MIRILLLLTPIIFFGCADLNQVTEEDFNKPFEFVFEVPGKTKDEIFSASKAWIAQTFVSGKAVTEDADKEAGRIIGNGRIPYPCDHGCYGKSDQSFGFSMRIDIKNEKFRIIYSNALIYRPPTTAGTLYIKGGEHPIRFQGDLDAAKLGFIKINDSLLLAVKTEKTKSDF